MDALYIARCIYVGDEEEYQIDFDDEGLDGYDLPAELIAELQEYALKQHKQTKACMRLLKHLIPTKEEWTALYDELTAWEKED